MAEARTINDATCLGCGCLCDDLRVTLRPGQPPLARPECSLADAWLSRIAAWRPGGCLVDAKPASEQQAIDRAVDLLRSARAPLVCGLAGGGSDAQRIAVGVADLLGGFVDWTTRPADAIAAEVMQTLGGVGASLGEVAQRADLVVFWRCDPATTHPRHFDRYCLSPTSAWLPRGRADRQAVLAGDPDSATAGRVDDVIPLAEGESAAALAALRRELAGSPPWGGAASSDRMASLAERLRASRFAAVFYDDALSAEGAAAMTELTLFAQSIQETTRLVTLPLGGGGNAAGAQQVVGWQTGFPLGVSFASGRPEYGNPEYTTESLLISGEADAVLVVATEGLAGLSDAALQRVRDLPSVVLSSEASDALAANVWFSAAPLGAAPAGAVFRSDGVALPLVQELVEAGRDHADVLRELSRGLASAATGLAAGPSAGGAG